MNSSKERKSVKLIFEVNCPQHKKGMFCRDLSEALNPEYL